MGSAGVRAGWPRLSRLLPGDVTTFRGPRWTAGLLAAVNVVGTARSLVHVLAPDSGAQSIASMDTQVAGGENIIALLAQWGGAQLLESGVIWAVLWRYRGLIPLMLGVVTAEQALRVGSARPSHWRPRTRRRARSAGACCRPRPSPWPHR